MKAATVNCDEHDWLCQQAGIGSYPSLRFYDGESTEVRHTHDACRTFPQHPQIVVGTSCKRHVFDGKLIMTVITMIEYDLPAKATRKVV